MSITYSYITIFGTLLHAFPYYQNEKMKILNISCPRAGIELTICYAPRIKSPFITALDNKITSLLTIFKVLIDIDYIITPS